MWPAACRPASLLSHLLLITGIATQRDPPHTCLLPPPLSSIILVLPGHLPPCSLKALLPFGEVFASRVRTYVAREVLSVRGLAFLAALSVKNKQRMTHKVISLTKTALLAAVKARVRIQHDFIKASIIKCQQSRRICNHLLCLISKAM